MGLFSKLKQGRSPAASEPTITIDPFFHDDGAARLSQALLARDWPTARDLLIGAEDSDTLSLYVEIAADTPGVQEWIEGPIRDEPRTVWPLLVRGAHAVHWAWEARGGGTADTVSRDAWKVWFKRLVIAEDCLDEVVSIDPGCVEAWHYLITLSRARQLPSEERWRRFEGLVAADRHHLFGHEQMLHGLMAKWSGSDEKMFDFARTRAAANPGTLIPVLVSMAHLEYARRHHSDNLRDYFDRDEVGEELVAAAYASVWHDDRSATLLEPVAWNHFAMTLTLADHLEAARPLYEAIGEDWLRPGPWNSTERFLRLRKYAHQED
ncbi:hypothetical protein [Catellatospora vulcania]|uniref:hypothetical protein n=1 Tax=Catellatospora vulcania TaxID=1460450 RepID=UPI0012D386DB|nr:hypothetical protein [Catellatospora vulcania]